MNRKIFFSLPAALMIAVLLLVGSEPLSAQGSAEGPAIRDVISSQLAAFGRDDGAGAFAFASPTIRSKFQSPEIFMDMVRRHYAPVYRPSEVSFQSLHAGPRGPVQEVLLVGPDGQVVVALYFMQQQPDASWKINGVQLVEAPDQVS